MRDTSDELVCPECGGPIGQTSTFCMHCSADLTDRHPRSDASSDEQSRDPTSWIETETDVVDVEAARSGTSVAHEQDVPPEYRSTSGAVDRTKLLPDGLAIKAITFLLAMAAGLTVAIGSAVVVSRIVGGTAAYLLAILAWFGATAAFLRAVPG